MNSQLKFMNFINFKDKNIKKCSASKRFKKILKQKNSN
jgi:hypothetical protein